LEINKNEKIEINLKSKLQNILQKSKFLFLILPDLPPVGRNQSSLSAIIRVNIKKIYN